MPVIRIICAAGLPACMPVCLYACLPACLSALYLPSPPQPTLSADWLIFFLFFFFFIFSERRLATEHRNFHDLCFLDFMLHLLRASFSMYT